NWRGFYPYEYEKPTVAADGSTVVEIYYDRYYYLMTFDLGEDAYGTEPIYARYGATLGDVTEPTREGYEFQGWSENGTDIVTLPSTMPAENCRYTAVWKANDTAQVKVVFWGENPNDEEYSYLNTGVISATPGTEYTFANNSTVLLICGKDEHTHTAKCTLTCGKTEHTQHTDACISCSHVCGLDCYSAGYYDLEETTKPSQIATPTHNGVYTYETSGLFDSGTHYYLYLDGKWYRAESGLFGGGDDTEIENVCSHNHTAECYICEVHSHTSECYSCGKEEHTHNSYCNQTGSGLDSSLWTFVRSETVTVAADGSSVINVYYDRVQYTVNFYSDDNLQNEYQSYRITAKWGASILDQWPSHNGSSSWYVPNKSNTWQNSIQIMPVGGTKFWGPKTGNNSYIAYYYVEALPGATDTIVHNGVTYELHHTDTSISSGNVTDEERYAIEGFTFKEGTANEQSFDNAKFYYLRHKYAIEFYNPTTLLKTTSGVAFEAPLDSYDWTPDPADAPSKYEPGSMVFEGWYLNPECTGDKFNFKTHTMPAGTNDGDTTLTLYAKWVGIERTVEFYQDREALNAGTKLESHPDVTVPHGSFLDTVKNPENGELTFVGWFYLDDGEEKAIDFTSIPIRKDLQVYAKWSSKVMMDYIIYYKTQDRVDISIAHPVAVDLSGSALAGTTKTFVAKADEQLFTAYQSGYFPLTPSHSIVIEVDEKNNTWYTVDAETGEKTQGYIFWYVKRDAVPYMVRYVDKAGNGLRASKVVADNPKTVVTENFLVIPSYMPDAYQKQLVLNGSLELGPDEKWINTTDENGEAVQIHPDNVITFIYEEDHVHAYYREAHYVQNTDGQTWREYASAEKIGDIGTTYTIEPLVIPGYTLDKTVEGTVESGELTEAGMELKLYYKRNLYPYEVRYLEKDTGKVLAEPKRGEGMYQQEIPEAAIAIDGYLPVDPVEQTVYIRMEAGTDPKLNVITFYYIVAETSLTITKTWNCADFYGQDAIFTVSGGGLSGLRVVIPYEGKHSVTITGLKVGETYTVSEDNGWSWRFKALADQSIELKVDEAENKLTFNNTLSNNLWFDDSDRKRNHFGDPEESPNE
ncbi:MAG: InlB B-repeat-containing protein, partial [Clostridia bacterium]|nr:InlB B-repeat-containing protein [Clostridia bacterium]